MFINTYFIYTWATPRKINSQRSGLEFRLNYDLQQKTKQNKTKKQQKTEKKGCEEFTQKNWGKKGKIYYADLIPGLLH